MAVTQGNDGGVLDQGGGRGDGQSQWVEGGF